SVPHAAEERLKDASWSRQNAAAAVIWLISAAAGSGPGDLLRRLHPLLGPRLRPRLDRRLSGSGLFDDSGVAEKTCAPVRRQRADAQPMLYAFNLKGDPIGIRAVEHR